MLNRASTLPAVSVTACDFLRGFMSGTFSKTRCIAASLIYFVEDLLLNFVVTTSDSLIRRNMRNLRLRLLYKPFEKTAPLFLEEDRYKSLWSLMELVEFAQSALINDIAYAKS